MASSTPFGAFVHFESGEEKSLASPPVALRRDDYAGSRAPSAFELEHLKTNRHDVAETPGPSLPQTPAGFRTPVNTHGDIEMSRPSSPRYDSVTEVVASLNNPPRNKWRFAALCFSFFAMGFNDSSTGSLIPYMEKEYTIPYGTVSIIFVTNAIAFILAATYTNWLEGKLGRSRHLALASFIMAAGYAMMVGTPPFAVICIAFFFTGTGMAIGIPPTNVFICSLTNSTTLLGILHGSYGVGGICGPLIATALVESGVRWSRFYAICLGVSAFNSGFNYWANIGFETDKPSPLLAAVELSQRDRPQVSSRQSTATSTRPPSGTQTPAPPVRVVPAKASWRQTLSRTTLLAAPFIFAYQGSEVSISGWVLSFLLAYRAPPFQSSSPPASQSGYNPLDLSKSTGAGSLGYVTSGFWAGLTLARFLATDKLASTLGEMWAVFMLTASAACFQLLVWLIPNLIAESVAIAILGVLLGPIYPIATTLFVKYLDRKVQVSSLAIIAALGSSGGAVAPFLVGIIAQGAGVWVLHPICLGLYAAMSFLWFGVNYGRTKRSD